MPDVVDPVLDARLPDISCRVSIRDITFDCSPVDEAGDPVTVNTWGITALIFDQAGAGRTELLEVTATYPTATSFRLAITEEELATIQATLDVGWWVWRRASPTDEPFASGAFQVDP